MLAIDDDPVMIKQIEYAIVQRGFEEGWIKPQPPRTRTRPPVAVIGSGPAGLAAAAELNQVGHRVTVYERDEAPGGLMRFGVPDAKLEKWMIDRRVALLEAEGIEFEYGADVGGDVDARGAARRHDAVVVAIGSRVERDFEVPGPRARRRALRDGLPLPAQPLGRALAGPPRRPSRRSERITAEGKRVVVIGGGDTGHGLHLQRQPRGRAVDATLLDVYPELPAERPLPATRPGRCRRSAPLTTYALDEGGERRFGHQVTALEGGDGRVAALRGRQVTGTSSRDLEPVPGSEFELPPTSC